LAILLLTTALAILDRVGMALLVQPIEATLHISDTQMGLLQGAGFALFFAVLGLPAGFLADRTNRRGLIAAGIAAWSVATIACGLATGFVGLFAARVCVGAGEATVNPAGASLVGDYFRPQSRSRAFAVYGLGSAIGAGTAFFLTGAALKLAQFIVRHGPPSLAATPAWKLVFVIFGAPGLLIAVLFAVTVKEPPRREGAGPGGPPSVTPLIARLTKRPFVYAALIGATVAATTATYAVIAWFPTFMIRTYGWSAGAAAGIIGSFSLPCGVISCLAAGWLMNALERRDRQDAPILVAALALICLALANLGAGLSPTAAGSMAGYAISATAMNFPFVALLVAVNRVTPNALRGQVLAVAGICTGLVSQTAGPLAVGYFSDHLFGRTRGLGLSLAAVIGVTCAAGAVMLLGVRRYFLAAAADLTT
jgi:MFS family permease